MKAALCKTLGPPEGLVVEDVPDPSPGPGQVLLDVKACGVAFPDTLIVQGKYQFQPDLPFAPGSEVAGVVKELGEGVSSVKPGDRVIAAAMWGGFAEQLAVDAARLIPMPPEMDFASASGFLMNYATSYYALADRARLQEGETLLVLGAAGGVGLTAVELGAVMGARVIAAASTDEKLELCRKYGASETINYSTEDLRARLKEIAPGGPDVIYDPVGGSFSEQALRSIAWKGRFLVIGFTAGDIPKIALNLPLLKGCEIVGVFWGSFTQREPKRNAEIIARLMELYVAGKIHPHVSATYPLERASEALRAVMDRKAQGKIVIVVDETA
jgi:NADPH:quinone reductase